MPYCYCFYNPRLKKFGKKKKSFLLLIDKLENLWLQISLFHRPFPFYFNIKGHMIFPLLSEPIPTKSANNVVRIFQETGKTGCRQHCNMTRKHLGMTERPGLKCFDARCIVMTNKVPSPLLNSCSLERVENFIPCNKQPWPG